MSPGIGSLRYRIFAVDQQYNKFIRSACRHSSTKIVIGTLASSTCDDLRHFTLKSGSFKKLGKPSATFGFQVLPFSSTFHVDLDSYHLFPPSSPFRQSSPNEYFCNQTSRAPLSRRRIVVEPSNFSQTTTASGVSVSASTSISE